MSRWVYEFMGEGERNIQYETMSKQWHKSQKIVKSNSEILPE
jgi:hypothetical protein